MPVHDLMPKLEGMKALCGDGVTDDTISRNLFGSTFYTLVGFHGLHVTAGLTIMLILLGLGPTRRAPTRGAGGARRA